MIEHLALLGWSTPDGRETFDLDELARLFSLERMHGVAEHVRRRAAARVQRARAARAAARTAPYDARRAHAADRLLEEPVPEAAHRWIETFLDAFGGEVHTLGDALDEVRRCAPRR